MIALEIISVFAIWVALGEIYSDTGGSRRIGYTASFLMVLVAFLIGLIAYLTT